MSQMGSRAWKEKMRCYWERIGILGPTYRLLGRGWSNHDIANYLGRTDEIVDSCVQWIMDFLPVATRSELVVLVAEPDRNNEDAVRGKRYFRL